MSNEQLNKNLNGVIRVKKGLTIHMAEYDKKAFKKLLTISDISVLDNIEKEIFLSLHQKITDKDRIYFTAHERHALIKIFKVSEFKGFSIFEKFRIRKVKVRIVGKYSIE
tara:strand:- start:2367 stop:2696 length:330 start_codon:yes stop_codon:yes gene_type:complete